MTTTEQNTTWLKFHVFQAKIEKKYIPKVYKELLTQIKAFNNYMTEVGYGKASSQINDHFSTFELTDIINDIHKESAGKYGAMVYNQFANLKSKGLKRIGLFGLADEIAILVLNQIKLSLLNNVHGILDTVKDDILQAIALGQVNGWSYDKTALLIEQRVGSTYRAQRIVRTESVKASNMGGMAGAQRTGLLMDKIWINAKDLRVRGNPVGKYPATQFDHWDIGGQTVSMNQSFFVGGESLQFPGDPNGSAGNIINCRCVAGYIPRRDENGLPIRIAGVRGTFKPAAVH